MNFIHFYFNSYSSHKGILNYIFQHIWNLVKYEWGELWDIIIFSRFICFILFIALLNVIRIYIMQKVTCSRARMKASWFLIKESGQALKHLKMSSEFASCSAIKIALVNSLNFRYCSVANSNICLLSVSSLRNIQILFMHKNQSSECKLNAQLDYVACWI